MESRPTSLQSREESQSESEDTRESVINNSSAGKSSDDDHCSFCPQPKTRHDLCNRCRQKVESRAQRYASQKMAKDCQCGKIIKEFLVQNCAYLDELTFRQGLRLIETIFPFWVCVCNFCTVSGACGLVDCELVYSFLFSFGKHLGFECSWCVWFTCSIWKDSCDRVVFEFCDTW